MGEICTALHHSLDDKGDTVYTITSQHTVRDVLRHLFYEGYDASELVFHVKDIEESLKHD